MAKSISSATLAIIEAASQWLVRMHGETVMAKDNKAFANWLKESPVHVREYLAAELLWADLQQVDFNNIGVADKSDTPDTDNIATLRSAI